MESPAGDNPVAVDEERFIAEGRISLSGIIHPLSKSSGVGSVATGIAPAIAVVCIIAIVALGFTYSAAKQPSHSPLGTVCVGQPHDADSEEKGEPTHDCITSPRCLGLRLTQEPSSTRGTPMKRMANHLTGSSFFGGRPESYSPTAPHANWTRGTTPRNVEFGDVFRMIFA